MCGIAGYVSLAQTISEDDLRRGAAVLNHRGPDADGFFFTEDKRVGLAHRRLAILDLSASANQPMFSANGRFCIVFNGEVYNFRELAAQLGCGGKTLRTTSDTEVILELFAQKGPACFADLNGMFALAIFDTEQQILTLARDHVGIKPLFIYQEENALVFGSELKTIPAVIGRSLPVNQQAIPFFLHLGFIPQPLTIYEGVTKFPAGHYAQVAIAAGLQLFNSTPFWQLKDVIEPQTLKEEITAKKQLTELLYDAVSKQLVSDVPIGTFLSGGIDSSLVTAIAARIGSGRVKTFSIAIDDGKHNEAAYAKRVAAHLQTEHHEFEVKEKEVMELVYQFLPAYDEPFADSSAFPTMMVSRLARQHVTVALSGDGGDELFHGYGMYAWANRLSNPLAKIIKAPAYSASRLLNSRFQRIGNMFGYQDRGNIITHIFSQEQYYFREQELNKLLVVPSGDFKAINRLPQLNRKLESAERQSFWDFEHYLKDDLLVKVDRASMQYSLESRVPLLDVRLVEFAFNLDESLKRKEGAMKYLLKQVLYDHVPKEIFNRPKWGFGIPLAKWLKSDLKFLLDKYTSKAMIETYNAVNFSAVDKLKKEYLNGTDYLFNRLWLIIILHWWLDENERKQMVHKHG
ncbi:MAG: asparagine synthase (glutamine-hydrolyzing) [Ferruginibacter sp.]|nr:asparagine synthase (glutamine-hydrolyzing) [Ferruginibacter sp.]